VKLEDPRSLPQEVLGGFQVFEAVLACDTVDGIGLRECPLLSEIRDDLLAKINRIDIGPAVTPDLRTAAEM